MQSYQRGYAGRLSHLMSSLSSKLLNDLTTDAEKNNKPMGIYTKINPRLLNRFIPNLKY